ncbi:MAG: hypothetical protein L6R41_001935 [Letrouitia leprolyta]|nr:MAG: hypothetical protein L6R41_001935 [Letrouitia leprolyta]
MHLPAFAVLFFAALVTFFQSTIGAPAPMPSPQTNPLPVTGWPGWNKIEKLFVFGASYTTTGFNWLQDPLPSPDLPLGNSIRGRTSSNGPNFITYLTTTFNASKVQTYNFAFPGAQVDHFATNPASVVKSGNDMRLQVNNGFVATYTPKLHAPFAQWDGSTSLFISFFGINDILAYYKRADTAPVTSAIMDAYATHLDTLYATGARSFLLLNSPPIDLAPYFNTGETVSGHGDRLTASQRASDRARAKTATEGYNSRFPSLVRDFQASHPDAMVFWYDTHSLFTSLLSGGGGGGNNNELSTYTQAYSLPDPITNLQGSCEYYTVPNTPGGTAHEDYLGEDDAVDYRCEGSVGSYFWLNGLHVTWSVHKILAGRIAEGLWGGVGGMIR